MKKKVIWLLNIIPPQLSIKLGKQEHYGGGWISSLLEQNELKENVELHILSPSTIKNETLKIEFSSIKYYLFPQSRKDVNNYNSENYEFFLNLLNDINPDIVHIFGTEYPHSYAMVNAAVDSGRINKTILNLQGLVSIISKHYDSNLPYSALYSLTFRDLIKLDNIYLQKRKFEKRGKYEILSIKNAKNLVGRTEWDKSVSNKYNPNAKYYHCNEILRSEFYEGNWDINNIRRNTIFVSQSSYPIKGFHIVLRAVNNLKKQYPNIKVVTTGTNPLNLNFLNRLVKISSYQKYISDLIIKYNLQENVIFLGSLSAEEMKEQYLRCNVFVSSSFIENESNSLSEAKILGVPCVSSYVGGVVNRIIHGFDGFLYQENAVYMLEYYISNLFSDDNLALHISNNAKRSARIINNKNENIKTLLNIYSEIN